jgi:hypothetical protein
MRRNRSKKKSFLLALNALLVFALAFMVGSQLARAQDSNNVAVFDYDDSSNAVSSSGSSRTVAVIDPQLSNYMNGSGEGQSAPATALYPEFKDQLTATVNPEIPKPGEEVTITLEVYSFDINSTLITWKIDGKQIERGIGIKKFNFKTKQAGQKTTVTALVEPSDRPSILRTFNFAAGEVDLLWQSDVYTPPFYKGKSMFSPEATLLFVAMPRTSSGLINPKEVVFNWRINNNNDAENSGFGRNTYSHEGPIIMRPAEVSVETYEARGGKAVAAADLIVENSNAFALFYENHPLYGVLFNQALTGSILLTKNEFGLSAYPYFQSIGGKNSGPFYSWDIDANGVAIPANQNTVTLRKNSGDEGQSTVDLQITNPNKILQSTRTGLSIEFDTSRNALEL